MRPYASVAFEFLSKLVATSISKDKQTIYLTVSSSAQSGLTALLKEAHLDGFYKGYHYKDKK